MEVSTDVQASAFINNGWMLVEDKKVEVEKPQLEKKDTNVKRKTKTNSK